MRYFLSILCLMVAVLVGCSKKTPLKTGSPVLNAVGNVINLNQGWDQKLQSQFWFTTQGSRVIPYDWFLVLEQANSQELFRSDKNIERLRFLPAEPDNKWNPDGLPLGLVKTDKKDKNGQHWMGPTCAFCHTTQVNYKDVGLRIDGGGTMGDFNTLFSDLVAALRATKDNESKFKSFANKILGEPHTPVEQDSLHTELTQITEQLAEYNALSKPTHPAGYARVDAVGLTANNVLVTALDQPDNAEPPKPPDYPWPPNRYTDAPVSYPFLWDTPQHDIVQWNGSASNTPPGPLARNAGEVIGMFGGLRIKPGKNPLTDHLEYENNINIKNLGELEKWLGSLWSPQWPTKYLGDIDSDKADKGQVHYGMYCQGCHALIDRESPLRQVIAHMTPVKDVGTDAGMATVAATRTGTTGILEGKKVGVITGNKFGSTATSGELLQNEVIGVLLSDPGESFKAAIEDLMIVNKTQALAAIFYKARPLNGIWATAPYLHNGFSTLCGTPTIDQKNGNIK